MARANIRLRECLERNKVYFETFAATMLGFAGLMVAWRANGIAEAGNKIADGANEIAEASNKISNAANDLTLAQSQPVLRLLEDRGGIALSNTGGPAQNVQVDTCTFLVCRLESV